MTFTLYTSVSDIDLGPSQAVLSLAQSVALAVDPTEFTYLHRLPHIEGEMLEPEAVAELKADAILFLAMFRDEITSEQVLLLQKIIDG